MIQCKCPQVYITSYSQAGFEGLMGWSSPVSHDICTTWNVAMAILPKPWQGQKVSVVLRMEK